MKARYKGKGDKTITEKGLSISFPGGAWINIPNISFYKKLSRYPDVFDVSCNYNLAPFTKFEKHLEFDGQTVRTSNPSTIRFLDKSKDVVRQAKLPELNIVIYRIVGHSPTYLPGYISLGSEVRVLCKREKGGIGDIIMASAIPEAIRAKYLNYVVDFAVPEEFLPLLENNPFIRKAIPFGKENEDDYDIVYDMTRTCIQYEGKKQPFVDLNRPQIWAKQGNLPNSIGKVPRPKIYLSEREEMESKRDRGGFQKRKIVGLALESSASVRSYPYIEELVEEIFWKDPECVIYLFTQNEDLKPLADTDRVFVHFDKPMRELVSLVNLCDVVIGVDTGIMHVAASLRVATVWLFTHTDGEIRTNCYDAVEVLQGECEKGPCWYEFPCSTERENIKVPACALSLKPEAVVNSMIEFTGRPTISYVVVCHNCFGSTVRCMNKVFAEKKFTDEVILIDNGSTDQTQGIFSELKIENFRYVRNEENLGCVKARNQGMDLAQGRFLLTLDNDQFLSTSSVDQIKQVEADVVGVEGWSMDLEGMARQYSKTGLLHYVGAGGMMVKKEVAEELGYFDEIYSPAWFEDPDFCFKAKKAGYIIGLAEKAGVVHEAHTTSHSQKTFNSSKVWAASREKFLEKWGEELKFKPVISIVILSHNEVEATIRCLKSIKATTAAPHEIIVIDNASDEDQLKKLMSLKSVEFTVHPQKRNLMVAAGRNLGAQLAHGEFVLFLDNDMILHGGWDEALLDIMGDKEIWACAPKIVDYKGGKKTTRFISTFIVDGAIWECDDENLVSTELLPGGAMMARRELMLKFPFDESFVFGVEDYDWCMKVRKRGAIFRSAPSVEFSHVKDPTKPRTVTKYDKEERERKGTSFIQDSIALFLWRYRDELPNQFKRPGWARWILDESEIGTAFTRDQVLSKAKEIVKKVCPGEIKNANFPG